MGGHLHTGQTRHCINLCAEFQRLDLNEVWQQDTREVVYTKSDSMFMIRTGPNLGFERRCLRWKI